jgi:hypothetical protein
MRCWSPVTGNHARQLRSGTGGTIVVVEGANDVEFLRRISAVLHSADPLIPDLLTMERQGELIFVPFGGGTIWPWAFRLAHLNRREFHVYDRETPPETMIRQQVAEIVNHRPGCHAVITKKRSLENYLHPGAIFEARGITVEFSDVEIVADLVARRLHEREGNQPAWDNLSPRTRKRRRNRAKRWLNTTAVERMTAERLAERDPDGEIRSWLETIARMAAGVR